MATKSDPRKRVIAAAMDLAATEGWRRVSLGAIAEAAGLSLAGLYDLFLGKGAILRALVADADAAMLSAAAADTDRTEETARDRLFEVLMARFDALRPYRDGIASVVRDSVGDPFALVCGGPRLLRSMHWALEAAGISSSGQGGRVRAKGLAAIYVSTFFTWLRDDSEDMAKTMASLDRALARADRLAALCWGRRRMAEPEPERPAGREGGERERKSRRSGRGGGGAKPAPA